MSKITKDLKKIKKITKELPSKEDMEAILKKVAGLQAQMDELVEQKRVEGLVLQKELFKASTDKGLHQEVADILSDKSNWDDVMELLQSEGIDATWNEVIEFMKEPLKNKFKLQFNAIISGVSNKLKEKG